MKRITCVFLVLIYIICCFSTCIAEDNGISTYASDLIASSTLTISNPSGTTIKATATVVTNGKVDQAGISVIRIQEKRNGIWTTVTSATGVYGYDCTFYRTTLSYAGKSGKQYRTTCTFYVYHNGSSDTSSLTSSTFEIA